MGYSNTMFAAEPIEGPLDLGLEEVIQAKTERVIGRGNSMWKTWQKVQASESSVALEHSGSRRGQRRPMDLEEPWKPPKDVWIAFPQQWETWRVWVRGRT